MSLHLLVRRGFYFLVLILLCVSFAGCATRTSTIADPLRQTKEGEVDMASLRQMTDDSGTALTDSELRVLASTGELDRNLSPSEMNDVASQYKYFLRKFRPSMEKFVQRSEGYLAYSKKVFRERGMPEELAYLAIVESGYNPQAKSPAGAAGSWQFMPFTGSRYGLEQSWWHDERMDPYKSAISAADYLKKLYGDFGDWHLAIAAYNAGEGKIGRALEATQTKNFSDLKLKNHTLNEKARLRDETKQYVPRFLAVCKIMRNLDSLGFKPINPESSPEKVALTVPPGTDLLALSQNVNSNWGEFSANNPSFKRYVSSPSKESVIYLPREQHEAARAFLRKPEVGSLSGWQSYTVCPKEDWDNISRKCNVPSNVLREANAQRKLIAGTPIRVPASTGRDVVPLNYGASTRLASAPATSPVKNGNSPAVASAKESGSSSKLINRALAQAEAASKNQAAQAKSMASVNIKEKDQGPTGSLGSSGSLGKTQVKKTAKNSVHVVQPGDTYWSVARKYSLNPKDLIKINGEQPLKPGATLVLAE